MELPDQGIIRGITPLELLAIYKIRALAKKGWGHLIITYQNGRCVHIEQAEKTPPEELRRLQDI